MNANAPFIEHALSCQIEKESGLDQHRDYLGISKIAECPRKAYDEYMNGTTPTESAHRFCYAGYHQEADVLRLLNAAGIEVLENGHEVVSHLDQRLRGHIDGHTLDGHLVEVKSLNADKFRRVQADGRALFKHFVQVQLYMRYGGWEQAFIIYRCRDTYEHFVVEVPYQPSSADKFERKAMALLASIDRKERPACECGHCKE